MKRISLLVVLFICIIYPINALERIDQFKWNARIILFRATGGIEEVLNRLRNVEYEIQDRGIYWFLFAGSHLETNYKGEIQENFYKETLQNYFNHAENNMILIGKDGNIKKISKNLDLQSIFDLIDTMPMRQLEMRQKH